MTTPKAAQRSTQDMVAWLHLQPGLVLSCCGAREIIMGSWKLLDILLPHMTVALIMTTKRKNKCKNCMDFSLNEMHFFPTLRQFVLLAKSQWKANLAVSECFSVMNWWAKDMVQLSFPHSSMDLIFLCYFPSNTIKSKIVLCIQYTIIRLYFQTERLKLINLQSKLLLKMFSAFWQQSLMFKLQ